MSDWREMYFLNIKSELFDENIREVGFNSVAGGVQKHKKDRIYCAMLCFLLSIEKNSRPRPVENNPTGRGRPQNAAQRSGCDLERRSSAMNAL